MAILYRTAKFKFANILAIVIWAQLPNLIPANNIISGYTIVSYNMLESHNNYHSDPDHAYRVDYLIALRYT